MDANVRSRQASGDIFTVAGESHRLPHSEALGQRFERAALWTAADEIELRIGECAGDDRRRSKQHVVRLASIPSTYRPTRRSPSPT